MFSGQDELERFLLSRPATGRRNGAAPDAPRERTREVLAGLGDPQEAVRTVHVAGTAGKGSVCAFVASLLTRHGFRVGVQASPHVYGIRERFRTGDLPVRADVLDDRLAAVARSVAAVEARRGERCSFFEVVTALGFAAVAGRADYAVVETGIGGRLDPTNVVARPDKLAVLTAIGLDHVDMLGSTLGEIATQKAGILPVGGRAVLARGVPESDAAVAREAVRRDTLVDVVDVAAAAALARTGPSGTTVDLAGWSDVPLGLHGRHQAGNAVLALHAVSVLARRDGWRLDPLAVRQGLALASLPGRFERRTVAGTPVVLDGAHDALKLSALATTVAETHPGRPVTWVLALARDKDLGEAVRAVAGAGARVVATGLPGGEHASRHWSPSEIAAAAGAAGVPAVAVADPGDAVDHALTTGGGDPVVVTGSFRLPGAVTSRLDRPAVPEGQPA